MQSLWAPSWKLILTSTPQVAVASYRAQLTEWPAQGLPQSRAVNL